jgi:hypothetical protein
LAVREFHPSKTVALRRLYVLFFIELGCFAARSSEPSFQPSEAPNLNSPPNGDIERRDRLGGLVHEYYRTAA